MLGQAEGFYVKVSIVLLLKLKVTSFAQMGQEEQGIDLQEADKQNSEQRSMEMGIFLLDMLILKN